MNLGEEVYFKAWQLHTAFDIGPYPRIVVIDLKHRLGVSLASMKTPLKVRLRDGTR